MARRAVKLAFLSLLTVSSNAFKLQFHDNDQCAGEFLGSWVGGVDQGCRQDFAGVAQSVTVLSTGKVDDAYIVKFYDTADCSPGSDVAMANVDCLTVDSVTVQGYKSFNVVLNSIDTPTKKRPRAPTGEMGFAKRELIETQPSFTHGQLAHFHGTEYRWQQVTADSWIGILPHEWNDTVHTQNTEVLEIDPDVAERLDLIFARHSSALAERGLLDERAFLDGVCQTTQACLGMVGTGGLAVAAGLQQWFGNAWTVALAKGAKLNDILNANPFVSQLIIQVAATTVQVKATMGGKTSGDASNVCNCSTMPASTGIDNRTIDAWVSALLEKAKSSDVGSITMDIQDRTAGGDIISSISISIAKCGDAPASKCGGIDPGFCPA